MGVLDDLAAGFSNISDATAKGAKKLAGEAKVKYNIHTLKVSLEKKYAEIGKFRYDEFKSGVDNLAPICEACAEIDRIKAEIKRIEETGEVKSSNVCANCGASLPAEGDFCPKCGTKRN